MNTEMEDAIAVIIVTICAIGFSLIGRKIAFWIEPEDENDDDLK